MTTQMKKISNLEILINLSSAVSPAAKVTKRRFAILEPITFPTEISADPFITASIETTSSQSEVPNPITMSPRKNSDICNFFPIATALVIRTSAPLTRSKSPKNKPNALKSI